jgi:cation diffusion facilitator family transporter
MTAIIAALIGNFLVATTKFIAAYFTGSSAMLSEGFHSVVDTGNELLLMLGIHRSQKPPDEEHPFGHGRELYFWTTVVSFSIFGIGGGLSIYEGILHMIDPEPIREAVWSYAVLGASTVFESVTWYFGWRSFSKVRRGRPIIEAMRESKDPTSFVVILEDSAALAGLAIAFFGVLLNHQFGLAYADGIASIMIGTLLCLVALFLGGESKSLLIGEAVSKETLREMKDIARAEPAVESVQNLLTIYIGPEDVAATFELKFKDDIGSSELRRTVRKIEQAIRERYPRVKRVFYEAGSISKPQADAKPRHA